MIYLVIALAGVICSFLAFKFLSEKLRRSFGIILMITSGIALFTLYPEKIENQLQIIIASFVFGMIISSPNKKERD
jgi:hypothetical protein